MHNWIRILACVVTSCFGGVVLAGDGTAMPESQAERTPVMAAGRQVGAMFVSPNWIENPQLAEPYLKQIAEMGHSSVVIFIRWMKQSVLDRRVHDAIKAMTHYGHRCGLKVLLDTDPSFWTPQFMERHPEIALWATRSIETTIHDGRFESRLELPKCSQLGQILFEELSAAFIPTSDGYRYLPGTGISVTNQQYAAPNQGIVVKGELLERYSGQAVLYVTLRSSDVADFAHPTYLKAQQDVLDGYADVPLDGFTWDEPGKGLGDQSYFKTGVGFLDLFQKLNGYPLYPNLIYLDHFDGTSKAVKIRCDYYRALIEMNYVAQKQHNDYARAIFKKDLMFGTHQTWSGYPMDLVAGWIDYFKLGKVLTAAWTDGGWDTCEPKVVLHNYMLAEGIKKELGFRDAYYNDSGSILPAVGNSRYANRAKMLFHVSSFNGGVSEYCNGTVNYTQEPLKSAAAKDIQDLDRFDRMIGNAFSPYTDVACLYSWETFAAAPKWMARMYYGSILNTSLHLIDRGQYAAIMSGDSILKAEAADRCIKVGDFTYRVLLLPYINTLPEPVYRKAMQIGEAGVPVIVIGPPPEFTADGKSVADDFAQRVGFKPFTLGQYSRVLAEQTTLPAINEWELPWLDATYPVESTTAAKVYDQEDHLSYVKSASGSFYYMPTPDPREELVNLIARLTTPLVETYAEDAYYRFYPHRTDRNQMVVVAVAKGHVASFGLTPDRISTGSRPPIRPHSLKVLFRLNGGELTLKGGTWCAVRLKDGQPVERIGDCPDVRWNNQELH